MSSQEARIDRIRRLAGRAEQRIRLRRALHVGGRALSGALLVAIADVALRKVDFLAERPARLILGFALVGTIAAAALAFFWRLPERAGARALDRFYGLHDRLASALAFADRSEAARTPFMNAAIDDAVQAASGARPGQAVPFTFSRATAASPFLAAILVVTLSLEVRHRAPVAHVSTLEPVELAPDDLDDVKDFLSQLQQRAQSDDTKAAIEEFNRLVADIADKRLDRTDAFRHMQMLEEKLAAGGEADKRALLERLEKIGEEVKKAELSKPVGEALTEDKLEAARDAMHDLAKKLREEGGKVDKAKLDQLREALKKAAAEAEKRQQQLEQRRQELADEILKMKQKLGDGGAEEERSLLEKKQRELERLDRSVDEERNAGRQLDRLDRELQQAAEDLLKDLGASAQDLDQGAEDLNRMQKQEMSQQEKEELRQKLQEMRELLRQQGQNGKGQIARLKRFGRMARGQGSSGGQQGQSGQQGDGQDEGQGGAGNPQQGQGGDRQGQGAGKGAGESGETWLLGPNGEKLLMLSRGAGEQGQAGGEGRGSPRNGWGEGHDPKLQGAATNPKMGTQDTQVQGADTDQGGSRSQVILGAGERGFASRGYKKVYAEYHQVAEESLAKDEIPGGYRFYVKRYFQLIRPREER